MCADSICYVKNTTWWKSMCSLSLYLSGFRWWMLHWQKLHTIDLVDTLLVEWLNQHGFAWRRHQMETHSALLSLCLGNPPVTGEFPSQRPVTQSFDVRFDLRLSQRLSKQLRRRWFETLSRSSWRHCNAFREMLQVKREIFGQWRRHYMTLLTRTETLPNKLISRS